MERAIPPVGWLAVMMGAASVFPVIVARMETGATSGSGVGFIVTGCCLIMCGSIVLITGFRRRSASMPSGVRAAVAANTFFLAFLALELSDRSVRQGGKLFYWTTFLLPPALMLYYGLVSGRRWSWWIARTVVALGVLWFLGFLVIIPFAPLRANGVLAPWHARVYVACVTIVFVLILTVAFRSLGSQEARSYFRIVQRWGVAAKQNAAKDNTV